MPDIDCPVVTCSESFDDEAEWHQHIMDHDLHAHLAAGDLAVVPADAGVIIELGVES